MLSTPDDKIEIQEFFEQVSYALSLQFKEKWRHRYSERFINIFQRMLMEAFSSQKAIKISELEEEFITKNGYDKLVVSDFFKTIDISLYYPIIYKGR